MGRWQSPRPEEQVTSSQPLSSLPLSLLSLSLQDTSVSMFFYGRATGSAVIKQSATPRSPPTSHIIIASKSCKETTHVLGEAEPFPRIELQVMGSVLRSI